MTTTLGFTVDDARCTRCGQCVRDCPARIIVLESKAAPRIRPDDEENCLRCQHCLAVCPSGAISILERKPADSLPLTAGSLPSLKQMTTLVRGRRSVRHYQHRDVDAGLLQQLFTTLAHTPTGCNHMHLTFTTVDSRAALDRFRAKAFAALQAAAAAGRLPEQATFLHAALEAHQNHQADIIFRGAPHVLIVSAPADAPCPAEDVTIAAATFDLLAPTAGLGTVWCGMLKMLLESVPELKSDLGLPASHVYEAVLFGYPDVTYHRTVQREYAAETRRAPL